jgi:hypothetical protein
MEATYTSQPQTHLTDQSLTTVQHPHHPTTTEYIIEALGEGIKQNFLGYNIDMEFLTLTARSIAAASANSIKQHVFKPLAAKLHRSHGHHPFTQTSF